MRPGSRAPDLRGVAVLIVEDDFYLASDMRAALERCGATVHGPFAVEDDAIDSVVATRPRCAILDINLGTGPTFRLADRLADLSIPYVFITGYDRGTVPARFARVPWMSKPVEDGAMLNAVETLLA